MTIMASLNKVMLIGYLTRNPELRVTSTGLSVCKFRLATTRKFSSNGESKEETAFVDITAFGRQAETISKYLGKGAPIFVEGRLKFETWESKTGEKCSKLSVVLESFQFLKSNSNSSPNSNAATAEKEKPAGGATQPELPEGLDEDVPF